MRRKSLTRLFVGLLLLFIVAGPIFSRGVDLLVDWIWFGQEGFRTVYLTILKAQIALSSLVGMGFMVVAGLNLLVAHSLARRHAVRVYAEAVEFPVLERFRSLFRGAIWLGIAFIGYFVGEWGATRWLEYQLAQHAHQHQGQRGEDGGAQPAPRRRH